MSLIKGLTPAISSMMPNLNTTMQDLSSMLGDMMTESTSSTEHVFTTDQNNQDITTILDEAHNILEGKTKSSIPEPPSIQNITKEKEYAI